MASCKHVRSAFGTSPNSSMQQTPPSARTRAPACSVHWPASLTAAAVKPARLAPLPETATDLHTLARRFSGSWLMLYVATHTSHACVWRVAQDDPSLHPKPRQRNIPRRAPPRTPCQLPIPLQPPRRTFARCPPLNPRRWCTPGLRTGSCRHLSCPAGGTLSSVCPARSRGLGVSSCCTLHCTASNIEHCRCPIRGDKGPRSVHWPAFLSAATVRPARLAPLPETASDLHPQLALMSMSSTCVCVLDNLIDNLLQTAMHSNACSSKACSSNACSSMLRVQIVTLSSPQPFKTRSSRAPVFFQTPPTIKPEIRYT
jgi:hypothetical protein